uniref:ARAD1A11264p n=1 Tax=Blastobotrys adeninivorans TaxID=409370 RepID=A0A060T3P4_BLAAD
MTEPTMVEAGSPSQLPLSSGDQKSSAYEDNFIYEYAGRDDELRNWLHLNLPVAQILAGFRGDADLIVINGDSPRASKVIQKALYQLGLKCRSTFGIASTVIIQLTGGPHSTVTALGAEMRDAALNDLVHRSNEEAQLERGDIKDCIARRGKEDTLLSGNVGHIIEVVHDNFGYAFPKKIRKNGKKKKGFIKAPDFSFLPLYREFWAWLKKRKLVSSVFGEVSCSDSAGKGIFDALLFVGGTKLKADLSVNADLKIDKINGQIRLKSLKVTFFNITAGNLLELSRSKDIDDKDRPVLRSAAKLKAREELESLNLLKGLINLPQEITLMDTEQIRSELFKHSGSQAEIFNYETISLVEECAEIYGMLQLTVERTIAYYEDIDRQVSDAKCLQADEMEEKVLRLVAAHPSDVTVTMLKEGNLRVDPPDGMSFPILPFSGLLPDGYDTSVLSADALSRVFGSASREVKSHLHETVPLHQLDGIKDIDDDSLEACARAVFPNEADSVNKFKYSLCSLKRKKPPLQVELQYLTRDALMRIGGKHYKIPSNASESLALAFAIQSVRDDRE